MEGVDSIPQRYYKACKDALVLSRVFATIVGMTMERMDGSELASSLSSIVAIIGPEGSGKSVLAKSLAEHFAVPIISTGGILRDIHKNQPDHPKYAEIDDMFLHHKYLSAESLLDLLKERFSQPDISAGCILDGGFRTVDEIDQFGQMLQLAQCNLPVTVLRLEIPAHMCVTRILAADRGRSDDTLEAITQRLRNFYMSLKTRLRKISDQGYDLVSIDAIQSPDDVLATALGAIRKEPAL